MSPRVAPILHFNEGASSLSCVVRQHEPAASPRLAAARHARVPPAQRVEIKIFPCQQAPRFSRILATRLARLPHAPSPRSRPQIVFVRGIAHHLPQPPPRHPCPACNPHRCFLHRASVAQALLPVPFFCCRTAPSLRSGQAGVAVLLSLLPPTASLRAVIRATPPFSARSESRSTLRWPPAATETPCLPVRRSPPRRDDC